MRVFDGSAALAGAARGCALAIGNFDGLHRGHQALLSAMVARARAQGRLAAVYSFDPHPRRVLEPGCDLARLMTRAQLEHGLRQLAVDALIREPFTRELAALEPAQFAEQILVQRVAPAAVFIGRDFRFGRGRAGATDLLTELGRSGGFEVQVVDQVQSGGAGVSSTRVRECVARGDVGAARELLGRPYAVWGRVVHGDGRGRELGFPTANVDPENELLPARGVYATRVQLFCGEHELEPGLHDSVTNIGLRPTFAGRDTRLETHLLGAGRELYGLRIAVQFWQRLREERAFAGPAALREQLGRDCADALAALGTP